MSSSCRQKQSPKKERERLWEARHSADIPSRKSFPVEGPDPAGGLRQGKKPEASAIV